MNIPDNISESSAWKQFFGLKILRFWSGIRNLLGPGSGMEKFVHWIRKTEKNSLRYLNESLEPSRSGSKSSGKPLGKVTGLMARRCLIFQSSRLAEGRLASTTRLLSSSSSPSPENTTINPRAMCKNLYHVPAPLLSVSRIEHILTNPDSGCDLLYPISA